jgi:hypothetical protein
VRSRVSASREKALCMSKKVSTPCHREIAFLIFVSPSVNQKQKSSRGESSEKATLEAAEARKRNTRDGRISEILALEQRLKWDLNFSLLLNSAILHNYLEVQLCKMALMSFERILKFSLNLYNFTFKCKLMVHLTIRQ